MDTLIKNMEMPKSCDICPFCKSNDDLELEDYRRLYCDFPNMGEFVTDYEASRHPSCPLIPVPVHGDLVQLDDALDCFSEDDIVARKALRKIPVILERTT